LIDYIRCNRIVNYQINLVARGDVLQATKKTVSMACDSEVSRLAEMSRPSDASHAAVQSKVVGALKDRHLKMNLWNVQYSQWSAESMIQALGVCVNPLVTPKAGVNAGSSCTSIATAMGREDT
jgi:hypothetical protein